MTPEEARRALATITCTDDERPILSLGVLRHLGKSDVPLGVYFDVGTVKEDGVHLNWAGTFHREGDRIIAEVNHGRARKYWYSPLGLEQYMDLLRRAVETRHRARGDVQLTHYEDDGSYIDLFFTISTSGRGTLEDAYHEAERVLAEIEEPANRADDEVGKRVAEIAARLSGWGSQPLDKLVHEVEAAASADDRGRSLEELSCRLFETVAGFKVTGRIRTATEEIDISIVNDSDDPRLRRESALILAECKNWTAKCGKSEFVLFREKLENRNRRCSLGFLISWNGFAGTVSKEMLRGSRAETLIVPITGADIRQAAAVGDFTEALVSAWGKAVTL